MPYENMDYSREWYEKNNPRGVTISEATATMKPWIDSGYDLEGAIRANNSNSNRVQFGTPYNALIDDTKEQQSGFDVNKTFQELLGRDAGTEGSDYWGSQYDAAIKNNTSSDAAIDSIRKSIMAGQEFQNRSAQVKAHNEQFGTNPSESWLDARVGPGGAAPVTVSPNTTIPGGVTIGPSTGSDPNMGPYQEGDPNIGGGNSTVTPPVTPPAASSNWYDGYGSGAEWLADNPQGTETTGDGKWDQFMEFMTALSGMGGMFGGGGGGYGMGYGGYGGFNPGGVASANPYQNMMNFMNAFKGLGSDKTSTVSTQNTNL